jgi:uncharacterized protein (UPF0332 family)
MKMTLEGLESIGFIVKEKTWEKELVDLLSEAERKLADSKLTNVSNSSRLGLAYTVIFLCATLALRLNGYRVKSKHEFHYKTIETLRHTLLCSKKEVDYFQILREKRHHDVYGKVLIVSASELEQAISEAEKVFQKVIQLLSDDYPGLITT